MIKHSPLDLRRIRRNHRHRLRLVRRTREVENILRREGAPGSSCRLIGNMTEQVGVTTGLRPASDNQYGRTG
jgi:hypothetical protein